MEYRFKPKRRETEPAKEVFETREGVKHLTGWAINTFVEDEWRMKSNDRSGVKEHLLECKDCQEKVTQKAEEPADGKSRAIPPGDK